MPHKSIFSNFALIGEDLALKQDVFLEIDEDGKILEIIYDDLDTTNITTESSQNYLLLPGFINSHTHIGDNFAKELGFNKELVDIVAPTFGLKHKLLRQTPDTVKIKGIQNAVLEMLSNGITFFIDFREEGVEGLNLLKKALMESPMNYMLLGRFMDESEIESIFELADGMGLSSYKQITSINKKLIIEAKQKFNKIIACHCAENTRNINLINDMFNDDFIDVIIHATKFIKDDLEEVISKSKSVVLCPRSNGYFGVGFPPINEIIKLKIPISLGTDNTMVNNTDLFEEIRYLYRISRILCNYDKELQLTSKDLLKMVTINAAKNFHLENKLGTISKGKFADIFLIDLSHSNLFSTNLDSNNIYDLITQRTKSENIIKTYIKGEVVFERRE